jgi:putative DNA methylase
MTKTRKKLIEVALPLEAINTAAAREKSIRHGHPSTLHLWWARRPLAAARAVIFAQMVDDPSSWPDLFPTEKKQEKERQRLFKIIEDLVQWENTTNEEVLQRARDAIWESWRRACAENADHPQAKDIFNRAVLPGFHDPFAGGGALPLEAQRLGLESYATDLNPVAVLINKAMIEIPPRFSGRPPVNPDSKHDHDLLGRDWTDAQGLEEDVRYYGRWIAKEARKRIGKFYPEVHVTPEMAANRADLKPYIGQKLTVIAWLWARTVRSPNPAVSSVHVPITSSFMLSSKPGKLAYIKPVVEGNSYHFEVKLGAPQNLEAARNGTKIARGANFKCLLTDTPIDSGYIKAEAKAGRMGARLMAVVAEGTRGRVYLAPNSRDEAVATSAKAEWRPDTALQGKARDQMPLYGMENFSDLFTERQLLALTTFSDLVIEARELIAHDAIAAGLNVSEASLADGGTGANAYAEAVSVYLAMAVDRSANTLCTVARWTPDREQTVTAFSRQAIQMTWDYPEVNPFSGAAGDFSVSIDGVIKGMTGNTRKPGFAVQADAQTQQFSRDRVVSTDPPYFDNICYADLSDFFYVWLRRSMKSVFPDLFSTVSVPKTEELVASTYRHGTKDAAEVFFLNGMTEAMHRIAERAHAAFPVTIYYAFKQSESDDKDGRTNTGWDTFLAAVIEAGFTITGTWPMRTELSNRMIGSGANALASSIVLVCRPRPGKAPTATRREFLTALKAELPDALIHLQAGNIAPVDLAQAAIGPGMAVYTRYAKVLDADGKALSVRSALALINQTLDEALAEQEGDFDADTRWALTWFDQVGYEEGEFGVANVLAQAKATGMDGLVEAGIIASGKGKVRLLKPSDLPADWDPQLSRRLTVWETLHRLVQAQSEAGESKAAVIVAKLGAKAETARELCYRLYTLCERNKRATDAMPYNALVQSWPEIVRLAQQMLNANQDQSRDLFSQE